MLAASGDGFLFLPSGRSWLVDLVILIWPPHTLTQTDSPSASSIPHKTSHFLEYTLASELIVFSPARVQASTSI